MIWDMEYTDSVVPLSYLYIGLRRLVQKGIIIIIDNVTKVKLFFFIDDQMLQSIKNNS